LTPVLREVRRLIWFGATVYLVLALASFSPRDPSWSTWSSETHFHNWMGRTGSVLADLLIQALGLGAWLVVFVGAYLGLLDTREEENRYWKWGKGLLWVLTFSAVLQAALPKDWVPWNLTHAGGVVGYVLQKVLQYLSATGGAFLWAWVFFLMATVFFFQR